MTKKVEDADPEIETKKTEERDIVGSDGDVKTCPEAGTEKKSLSDDVEVIKSSKEDTDDDLPVPDKYLVKNWVTLASGLRIRIDEERSSGSEPVVTGIYFEGGPETGIESIWDSWKPESADGQSFVVLSPNIDSHRVYLENPWFRQRGGAGANRISKRGSDSHQPVNVTFSIPGGQPRNQQKKPGFPGPDYISTILSGMRPVSPGMRKQQPYAPMRPQASQYQMPTLQRPTSAPRINVGGPMYNLLPRMPMVNQNAMNCCAQYNAFQQPYGQSPLMCYGPPLYPPLRTTGGGMQLPNRNHFSSQSYRNISDEEIAAVAAAAMSGDGGKHPQVIEIIRDPNDEGSPDDCVVIELENEEECNSFNRKKRNSPVIHVRGGSRQNKSQQSAEKKAPIIIVTGNNPQYPGVTASGGGLKSPLVIVPDKQKGNIMTSTGDNRVLYETRHCGQRVYGGEDMSAGEHEACDSSTDDNYVEPVAYARPCSAAPPRNQQGGACSPGQYLSPSAPGQNPYYTERRPRTSAEPQRRAVIPPLPAYMEKSRPKMAPLKTPKLHRTHSCECKIKRGESPKYRSLSETVLPPVESVTTNSNKGDPNSSQLKQRNEEYTEADHLNSIREYELRCPCGRLIPRLRPHLEPVQDENRKYQGQSNLSVASDKYVKQQRPAVIQRLSVLQGQLKPRGIVVRETSLSVNDNRLRQPGTQTTTHTPLTTQVRAPKENIAPHIPIQRLRSGSVACDDIDKHLSPLKIKNKNGIGVSKTRKAQKEISQCIVPGAPEGTRFIEEDERNVEFMQPPPVYAIEVPDNYQQGVADYQQSFASKPKAKKVKKKRNLKMKLNLSDIQEVSPEAEMRAEQGFSPCPRTPIKSRGSPARMTEEEMVDAAVQMSLNPENDQIEPSVLECLDTENNTAEEQLRKSVEPEAVSSSSRWRERHEKRYQELKQALRCNKAELGDDPNAELTEDEVRLLMDQVMVEERKRFKRKTETLKRRYTQTWPQGNVKPQSYSDWKSGIRYEDTVSQNQQEVNVQQQQCVPEVTGQDEGNLSAENTQYQPQDGEPGLTCSEQDQYSIDVEQARNLMIQAGYIPDTMPYSEVLNACKQLLDNFQYLSDPQDGEQLQRQEMGNEEAPPEGGIAVIRIPSLNEQMAAANQNADGGGQSQDQNDPTYQDFCEDLENQTDQNDVSDQYQDPNAEPQEQYVTEEETEMMQYLADNGIDINDEGIAPCWRELYHAVRALNATLPDGWTKGLESANRFPPTCEETDSQERLAQDAVTAQLMGDVVSPESLERLKRMPPLEMRTSPCNSQAAEIRSPELAARYRKLLQ